MGLNVAFAGANINANGYQPNYIATRGFFQTNPYDTENIRKCYKSGDSSKMSETGVSFGSGANCQSISTIGAAYNAGG